MLVQVEPGKIDVRDLLATVDRYGYRKTSMQDVADAVGFSRPSIYKTFGSKEACYRWTIQAWRHFLSRPKETHAMKHAILGARLLLGSALVVFGVNPWLQFLPLPELNEAATAFFHAMAASYLLTFVKITEVVCGLLLLAGRFVPLALTALAPVVLNILFFHVFLDTTGLALAIVLVALEVFLAWTYRDAFTGVLAMNAQPKI